MKYDFFIASRWRNKPYVLELAEKIKQKGKKAYCFIQSDASIEHIEVIKGNPEEQMQWFEAIKNWRDDHRIKALFESDMTALKNSKALILLLPAGKSAHLEAGAAYGMGKKCILIGEQKETESNYLIFDEIYLTIDSFIQNLNM